MAKQPNDLFAKLRTGTDVSDEDLRAMQSAADEAANPIQGELFFCDAVAWPLKDDIASMDVPIFSLSTKRDLKKRVWSSGNRSLTITPSVDGCATIFDKDLLLYVGSHIVEGLNRGERPGRTVVVDTSKFLTATSRGDGSVQYESIIGMLRRLAGTRIETNIETGGKRQTDGFSVIDKYRALSEVEKRVSRKDNDGKSVQTTVQRIYQFQVTVSEWFYNGLVEFHVLTLDRRYFELRSPIARKLYEIARRHVGDKPIWHISIDLLASKMGVKGERWKVREYIRDAIADDKLPDYHIALDEKATPDSVVFYTRNSKLLSETLIKNQAPYSLTWWNSLNRPKP